MIKLSVPVLRENQTPEPNQKFLRKPKHKISAPALLGLFSKHYPVNYFDLPSVEDVDSIVVQEPVTDNNSTLAQTLSDYESSDNDSSSDSDDD